MKFCCLIAQPLGSVLIDDSVPLIEMSASCFCGSGRICRFSVFHFLITERLGLEVANLKK